MKEITVKGLTLGSGRPKICVPVVGRSLPEILSQAGQLPPLNPDLCEWRVDWFAGAADPQLLLSAARAVREALPRLPLLFTFRTQAEGGRQPLSREQYLDICRLLMTSGCCDLIDLELFTVGDDGVSLLEEAHANGVLTVLSNHDFEATPPEGELLRRLSLMDSLPADLSKIAVMPHSPEDVLTLLSATCRARETAEHPIITMSMGPLGAVSRVCGEVFGSCLTFGSAGHTSAPGQIPVRELRVMMELLRPGCED